MVLPCLTPLFLVGFFQQFEYMAQHLVFANCIPLILKFFNQNIMSYITAKNRYVGEFEPFQDPDDQEVL